MMTVFVESYVTQFSTMLAILGRSSETLTSLYQNLAQPSIEQIEVKEIK